jgi:hypothetical protein
VQQKPVPAKANKLLASDDDDDEDIFAKKPA